MTQRKSLVRFDDMKKLSSLILVAYGGLAIPLAALGLPLVVYLPPFYAGPIGLGVGTVGLIFMIARFWDIFTDPIDRKSVV